MTAAKVSERLARPIGAVWPNAEQDLVLQAIFAPGDAALAAFQKWRRSLDLDQYFDRSIFRLLALLYQRLAALGVEDPLMGKLKGIYKRNWSDTHTLLHGTAPAIAALQQNNIPTLLLKGAPLVLRYYRNHGSRPMADIDIAVHAAQSRDAIDCLARAGWLPDTAVTVHDLRFRHALNLRGPHGLEIDLHWHMLFERCDDAADAIFWRHAEPLDYAGVATATLAPELLLLHVIVHGLRSNIEPPIRWIADALTILRQVDGRLQWPVFRDAAVSLGLARRVILGLRYLEDHHDAQIPPNVFTDLQAGPSHFAEALEIAVMLRPDLRRAPKLFRKFLLILAEFLRVTETQSWLGRAAAVAPFVLYRLGMGWRRNLHHGGPVSR